MLEPQPGDDLFDKVLLFLTNYIRPIAAEWKAVIEWLLLMSAMAVAAKISDQSVVKILSTATNAVFILYCTLGYLGWFTSAFREKLGPISFDEPIKARLKKYAISLFGLGLVWSFSLVLIEAAKMFSTELAGKIQ